jgi:hypothetical protein
MVLNQIYGVLGLYLQGMQLHGAVESETVTELGFLECFLLFPGMYQSQVSCMPQFFQYYCHPNNDFLNIE